MKYNDNIELDFCENGSKLKQNEYFVLMVTDEQNKPKRSQRDYFNYELG